MENEVFVLPSSATEKGGLLRGMKRVAKVICVNEEFKFEFCISEEEQKSRRARLYALVAIYEDGTFEVLKYGGSGDKGGIEQTLKWYEDGCSGRPDDKGRTVGVPLALIAAGELGCKVEVWMRWAPAAMVLIEGIYEDGEQEVSGYKEMEGKYVDQYIALKEVPPILNVQEAGERHPDEVRDYVEYYLAHDDPIEEEKSVLKNKRATAIIAYKKKLLMSRQLNLWKSGCLDEIGEQITRLKDNLLTEPSLKSSRRRVRKMRGLGKKTFSKWVEECIVAQLIGQSLEDCLNGKREFKDDGMKSARVIWGEVEERMKEIKTK